MGVELSVSKLSSVINGHAIKVEVTAVVVETLINSGG